MPFLTMNGLVDGRATFTFRSKDNYYTWDGVFLGANNYVKFSIRK